MTGQDLDNTCSTKEPDLADRATRCGSGPGDPAIAFTCGDNRLRQRIRTGIAADVGDRTTGPRRTRADRPLTGVHHDRARRGSPRVSLSRRNPEPTQIGDRTASTTGMAIPSGDKDVTEGRHTDIGDCSSDTPHTSSNWHTSIASLHRGIPSQRLYSSAGNTTTGPDNRAGCTAQPVGSALTASNLSVARINHGGRSNLPARPAAAICAGGVAATPR